MRFAVAAIAVLGVAACSGDWKRIPAQGEIAGHPVTTTVDSKLARAYLEDGPAGLGDALPDAPPPDALPARAWFAELAGETSPDVATLHLIRLIERDPANARLRRVFETHLERVRTLSRAALGACLDAVPLPPVWFVPGWFYETQPGTGADFARQRRLLDRLDVPNRLVPTIENGTVEENAGIVADAIRELDAEERIILVSVSKGGPEVAHALGHLLEAQTARRVAAWINIGGLLGGTPLADFATRWPIRWLAPVYFHVEGLEPGDSVQSLTTAQSRARLAQETMPAHLMLINFAGIPLSGQVGAAAEWGYGRMRELGPNDGLTLIVDELAHGGRTIVQVGLDHYFRDPALDLKTVALALTVVSELGHALPPACAPGAADGLRDRG